MFDLIFYSVTHWNDNIAQIFGFTFSIICFIIILVICVYNDYKNMEFFGEIVGFWTTALMSIIIGLGGGFIFGFITSFLWSMFVSLIPILAFVFLLYKLPYVIDWFKKYKRNSEVKMNKIIDELKAEELAKQAYENLRNDFPGIKYADVLNSIRGKIK